MGREIRRVPANWEHPRKMKYIPSREIGGGKYVEDPDGDFTPLLDDFEGALESFKKDVEEKGWKEALAYHGGGPNPDDYVDYEGREATWYQIYETVSEGTPVTPAFATKEELVEYLVQNGDFWDQKRRAEGDSFMPCDPWTREAAERFVGNEWAPSMVVDSGRVVEIAGRTL